MENSPCEITRTQGSSAFSRRYGQVVSYFQDQAPGQIYVGIVANTQLHSAQHDRINDAIINEGHVVDYLIRNYQPLMLPQVKTIVWRKVMSSTVPYSPFKDTLSPMRKGRYTARDSPEIRLAKVDLAANPTTRAVIPAPAIMAPISPLNPGTRLA